MRFALALTFLAAACGSDSDRPIGPGGGGGTGGTTTPDANISPDSMSAGSISGTLCFVGDMRDPDLCPAQVDIGGITIENALTGDITLSENDGSFALPAGAGDFAPIRVGFANSDYRDVLIPIGLVNGSATGVELPLVPTAVWDDVVTVTGIIETAESASLAAYFKQGSAAAVDVAIEAPQGTTGIPIYDGLAGPNDWSGGGGTGARGAAILVGIPAAAPSLDIVVQPAGEPSFTVTDVQVEPNVLTFITVSLP